MSIKQEKKRIKMRLRLLLLLRHLNLTMQLWMYLKRVQNILTYLDLEKEKAPFHIVERYYGDNIFYEDAFNELVPKVYDEEIKANKIEAVSRPHIDVVQMEKGKDLIFTAIVNTKPEVELGKFKGVEIKKS